ncbi:hypothetical protein [Planctomicrobium piriforme]|uniref:Uncharacterized protein n=1 Tax=Planctomicrobium piriforme TaxID=1576369 RepID=A0A1I3BER1_9PLAN|nr:hypothetical protein [Planctomicrobium piriforme]SFH60762.1 hypothetical protein SAMN05421753_101416 [Planctomicrobium piriforme]
MNTPQNVSDEQPFTPGELKQFDADDAQAGRVIGKMLSLFFLYTVFAMIGAVVATWYWVSGRG